MNQDRQIIVSVLFCLLAIAPRIGAAQDEPVDVRPFVKTYRIEEIKKEFPIRAGMTLEELDQVKRHIGSLPFSRDGYNLGWEERVVRDGSGWVYFWVNGKHLLHCDIVVEDHQVKSVWIMPGNREWVALVYYRISGVGPHVGPGAWYTVPGKALYQLVKMLEQRKLHPEELKRLHSVKTSKDTSASLRSLARSGDSSVKAATLTVLVEVAEPEEALPIVLELLDDEDSTVKNRAAKALAGFGSAAAPACERLARMAFTESFHSVWWIPLALRDMGTEAAPAVPILVEALQHSNTEVRENGLMALNRLGSRARQAIPSVMKLVSDSSETIRWQAIEALSSMGAESDEAIRVFARALEDEGEERRVRASAAAALGRTERAPKAALPELIRCIQIYEPEEKNRNSSQSEAREWAARAIGNIGPEASVAVPYLIPLLSDENDYVRSNAAEALGKIGPAAEQALPFLKKGMRKDWTTGDFLEAIERISTPGGKT